MQARWEKIPGKSGEAGCMTVPSYSKEMFLRGMLPVSTLR